MLVSHTQWKVLEPVALVDPVETRASYFLAMLYLTETTVLLLAGQYKCLAAVATAVKRQILTFSPTQVTVRVELAEVVAIKR